MTTAPTTVQTLGMSDHCHHCVRSGCTRLEATREPFAIQWRGGASMVTALYVCPCGHTWACSWGRNYLDDGEI